MFDTVSSMITIPVTRRPPLAAPPPSWISRCWNRQGFRYSVDRWLEKAQKAAVDYSFHMNLTRMDDTIAADIPNLPKMGIRTLKVFTAYNGRLRLDDSGIFRALRLARENGMLSCRTAKTAM